MQRRTIVVISHNEKNVIGANRMLVIEHECNLVFVHMHNAKKDNCHNRIV